MTKRSIIFTLLYLFVFIILNLFIVFTCVGCSSSKQYTHAVISLPDGSVISGELDDYVLFKSGRCKITIDGSEYMTHMNNVALMRECVEDDFEDD